MTREDGTYQQSIIKSFKHDGSLHRVWLENWLIPDDRLHPHHVSQKVWVMLNDHTKIIEADGKEWISRVPAVSFFMPDHWYNVVALIEDNGIRYYCNLASPPLRYGNVLTYIDYDLDVMLMPDGAVHELDRDEFLLHKEEYGYSKAIEAQVEMELEVLQTAIVNRAFPFGDAEVYYYYEQWKHHQMNAEGESN
ncbi:DUF402 domain-containing protein [Cohnella sp. WQ 127256]|uniref:DUF402 domain-containing protein n=1 Tax=Cohnella sp. WQ 127256 TaxID=2938790 RepID=UPI002118BE2D|nr:DUF402 domain-containing protein [Cohnella sp. WQ 127256]